MIKKHLVKRINAHLCCDFENEKSMRMYVDRLQVSTPWLLEQVCLHEHHLVLAMTTYWITYNCNKGIFGNAFSDAECRRLRWSIRRLLSLAGRLRQISREPLHEFFRLRLGSYLPSKAGVRHILAALVGLRLRSAVIWPWGSQFQWM